MGMIRKIILLFSILIIGAVIALYIGYGPRSNELYFCTVTIKYNEVQQNENEIHGDVITGYLRAEKQPDSLTVVSFLNIKTDAQVVNWSVRRIVYQ